jgi:parallel beta-helix repeat protein
MTLTHRMGIQSRSDGVYRENIKVTKSLTIQSLNGSADCIIQGARRREHVVTVTADCVNVSGFTVNRATSRKAGIYINAGYCNVSTNNCSNNYIGIHLDGSNNNIISGNDCSNNGGEGLCLDGSSNNRIPSKAEGNSKKYKYTESSMTVLLLSSDKQ